MDTEVWVSKVMKYLHEFGYHNAARSLLFESTAQAWISNNYPKDPYRVAEDFAIKASLPDHKEHSICAYS